MSNRPDLLLVFPPFWDGGIPYLSVPTLAAYLKQQDFKVESADLNKSCLKSLLTPEALSGAINQAERVLSAWSSRNGNPDFRKTFEANFRYCEQVWTEAGDSLVNDLYAIPPSDLDGYTSINRRLRWIFRILASPYGPLPSGAGGPVDVPEHDRLSALTEAVERAELPGADLIRAFTARNASRCIPVLGISIAAPSQMLPAFFLARTFKAQSRDTFICIGGPHLPYVLDALKAWSKPFDWVDAFVTGEGELPLRDICQTATHNGDMSKVNGLWLRRDGKMVYTGDHGVVTMDDLPPPDFTNFEPNDYLANNGSICLTFARGCSWSKCSFCTQFITFNGYRTMSEEKVAEHVETVTRRYAIKTISLNDENVTPERLREFGGIIRRIVPEVRWMTLARLSPKLADESLARDLADSGCVMLSLGLESADQQVLNLNRKGISVESVPAILRALRQAGIWVHVFVILGLPGETGETILRTIRFIHEHLDGIDSISPTVFRLESHSAIWRHPQEFGIIPDPVPDDWCSVEIPFNTSQWVTRGENLVYLEYLIHSLVGRRQCPLEQGDLNGQYLIQLFERHGTEWLRAEMEKRAAMSASAEDALISNDDLYREWMQSEAFQKLDADEGTQDVLLSIPSRGTYLFFNYTGKKILKLRSLGVSLDDIRKSFRQLVSPFLEDDTELEWMIDTFRLLTLTSRVIQDSLFPRDAQALDQAAQAELVFDLPMDGRF